ncbi:MAG: rhamnan synthesis F family protein [Victivallaceae bacterium]|nr:rhamnan synthesis F family protein [Victivallaceae bacterium]
MKILVHIHVYYPQLWPELAEAVARIEESMQLYVTIVREDSILQAQIQKAFPQAHVLLVENRGYDVGPFCAVLAQVDLREFDYLVKLHTKRDLPGFFNAEEIPYKMFVNRYPVYGRRWREYLLSFLSSGESFHRCLSAFEEDPKLGMTGNFRLILDARDNDREAYAEASELLAKANLKSDDFRFVAGTMFVARARLFEALKRMNFSAEDFAATRRSDTRSLAHLLERVIGGIICAQGYEVRDAFTPEEERKRAFPWVWYGHKLFRFFFQMRVTHSGHRMIKVFKIPVWRGRIESGGR